MNPSVEFHRRFELIRRIAELNARRRNFTREEELQFLVAARLFTYAELEAMHANALAAAQTNRCPCRSAE